MATSGSKSVTVTSWDTLKFSWSESSQSVANNTTTISWKLELISGSSGLISSSAKKSWSVTVNGKKYSGTNYIGISNNSTKTLASGTTTITHNSDGTKTFSYSFSQEFGITFSGSSIGTKSGSGSGTLDTIPRKSSLSASNGTLNTAQTLTVTRQATSFTHTITYKCGTASGTIVTKSSSTSISWTPPLSLASQNTTGTSVSVVFTITTYSGDTSIGSNTKTISCTIPASVKPSCTFTLEDTTGIDDIYGSPVQGLSKIKVTVTATQAYGSAIDSCSISIDGKKFSALTATTGVLAVSGKSTVTATVKDKRGRSGSVSYDMNVQAYTAPAVTALTAKRCNEDGTLNKRGDHIIVTFSAKVSSMSSKNTAGYRVQYKKSSETSYTAVTLSALANSYNVSNYSYIFPAVAGSSYNVAIEVRDRHNNSTPATKSVKVATAFAIFSWRGFRTSNGVEDGLGIGKVPEKPNALEIAWETIFYGKVSGTIFDAVYPVGSIYLAYNHTDPGTLFPGTTWERIEGAFPWFTSSTGTIGKTGGEKTVTLTAKQIPSHNHGGTYTNAGTARTHAWLASGGSAMGYDTVNTGGGEAHNNMPPYIQISAWRRTA